MWKFFINNPFKSGRWFDFSDMSEGCTCGHCERVTVFGIIFLFIGVAYHSQAFEALERLSFYESIDLNSINESLQKAFSDTTDEVSISPAVYNEFVFTVNNRAVFFSPDGEFIRHVDIVVGDD